MRKIRVGTISLLILVATVAVPSALTGRSTQDQELRAESYLAQADEFYSKGDYQKAIENYLQVLQIAQRKLNLSRANMGLSLSYFFLNDTEKARAHVLKTLEIDPRKEVSSLFYPQGFVDLFNQVREENKDRLAVLAAVQVEEPKAEEPKLEVPKAEQLLPEGAAIADERGGLFEVGAHFGIWSLSPAKGLFEDSLTKKAANEMRDNVTEKLNGQYGGNLNPSSYQHGLTLSSQGLNYGIEVRYFPLGRRGAFSIGLSLEKTHIKVTMKGPVTQQYSDGSSATVESDAVVETNPLTTDLSFRWDFVPSWRVTPYFAFGLGVGPLNGEARYTYAGTYQHDSAQSGVSGGETKTFDDLREEGEFDLEAFILLHLGLGVKGEIAKGIFIKGELGFWDGLVFRGGVAYRF
jgi:hypothetical protein